MIAGESDELMDAPAYQRVLSPPGARVTLIPGVEHMGPLLAAGGDQGDRRRVEPIRLLAAARSAIAELGPLIVFWALALTPGGAS